MRLHSIALFCGVILASCALPQRMDGDGPIDALPYSPSLDLTSMDRSADPCQDFYRYVCGGWMEANPIPPDQSSWSVYSKLHAANQRFLWGILEDLADRRRGRTPAQQKIGDYFAACMDEPAIEKLGFQPIAPLLDAIAALQDKAGLGALLARLHLDADSILFEFGANQDLDDAESVIAFATAGGLGLPDRDDYTRTDDKSAQIRARYVEHLRNLFVLLGDPAEEAQAQATAVMRLETALAKASLTVVEKRDPRRLKHPYRRRGLQQLMPTFDWDAYLRGLGIAGVDRFNVSEPKFYAALDRQLRSVPLDELKAYLRAHVAVAKAPSLSSAFVNESFAFYGRTLRGVEKLKPRWKRCVEMVDGQLGEALGQEFVARTFPPELKAKTLQMTRRIEEAMEAEIRKLDWMSAATKQRALEKLHAVANKVGYPERWRDYGPVEIHRDDFAGNVARATRFESQRILGKIGKPLDRGEWGMTPPTVNAYYDPQMNDINFPAGILQPPLYDARLDDAPNYGNTGATIGHELTHGFDDEGRRFDARGNLKDWWTLADARAFEARAQCVIDQYSQYTAIDEIRINGQLTAGEDIADLGGTLLAYLAWKSATAGQALASRDGFSPDQRFFIGNGQWGCENVRPEHAREQALSDPHSPARYRVNGVVSNLPEFARAFSCKSGDAMVRARPCTIW
jgi:putative endopeptidase